MISGYVQPHGWSIWGPSQNVLHNVTSIGQAQVILFPIAQGFTIASAVKGLMRSSKYMWSSLKPFW